MIDGLSGVWTFQRIVLECRCVALLFGRPETQLRRGDMWHCIEHQKANVRVIDILPVTPAEREMLTRTE